MVATRKHKSIFDELFGEFEEMLERDVTKHGNSGHVIIPKKHIGKSVLIMVKKKLRK